MKKYILLLITTLICCGGYAQDACSKTYMEALQAYQKGDYVDAQRLLIIVAQTCGDYSDVWKKLRDCNKKIADKQSRQAAEISTLKSEKQQIEALKRKAETDHNNDMRNAALQIRNAETLIRLKSDTIQKQRKWNMVWRDSVMRVNHALDSVTLELHSVNEQVIALQTELAEKASKDKNKRGDKKSPKPQEGIVPLVQDTLPNDTTNLIK